MIYELMESWEAIFRAEMPANMALEGVKSVKLGDFSPVADRDFPCISLEPAEMPLARTGQATGSALEWPIDIDVSLYTCDNDPRKAQRKLYELVAPRTPEGQTGLRFVLHRARYIVTASGTRFQLSPGPIRFGLLKPKSVFIAGAICTVRAISWGPHP